jgi:hypothetical protein
MVIELAKNMDYYQATDVVKFLMEGLASGVMHQAGKELFDTVKERFVGQPKAEQAIEQLEASQGNAPEAIRTLEVLLEAEIIKDDNYADRLRKLTAAVRNESGQEAAIDLHTTESVEIGKIEQSMEDSIGKQVAGKNITGKSIKIDGITQTQKQLDRDL